MRYSNELVDTSIQNINLGKRTVNKLKEQIFGKFSTGETSKKYELFAYTFEIEFVDSRLGNKLSKEIMRLINEDI